MTQPYFEDIKDGQEIPKVVLNCTSQQLVYWAAGSGDYYQIHYDKDFAQNTGLKERITHGALSTPSSAACWTSGPARRVGPRHFVSVPGRTTSIRPVTSKGVVVAENAENSANTIALELDGGPRRPGMTPGTAHRRTTLGTNQRITPGQVID
jgi:hypothetical protein